MFSVAQKLVVPKKAVVVSRVSVVNASSSVGGSVAKGRGAKRSHSGGAANTAEGDGMRGITAWLAVFSLFFAEVTCCRVFFLPIHCTDLMCLCCYVLPLSGSGSFHMALASRSCAAGKRGRTAAGAASSHSHSSVPGSVFHDAVALSTVADNKRCEVCKAVGGPEQMVACTFPACSRAYHPVCSRPQAASDG